MTVTVRMTVSGVEKLHAKMTNRANFLGSSRMGKLLGDMGKDLVEEAKRLEARLTPGAARDLTPGYKKTKKQQVGRVYPILWKTGAWLSSLNSRVSKSSGAGWFIRVGFAGQHPGGDISNQELYEIHARNGRNILNPPRGWNDKWMKQIQSELRSIR